MVENAVMVGAEVSATMVSGGASSNGSEVDTDLTESLVSLTLTETTAWLGISALKLNTIEEPTISAV